MRSTVDTLKTCLGVSVVVSYALKDFIIFRKTEIIFSFTAFIGNYYWLHLIAMSAPALHLNAAETIHGGISVPRETYFARKLALVGDSLVRSKKLVRRFIYWRLNVTLAQWINFLVALYYLFQ